MTVTLKTPKLRKPKLPLTLTLPDVSHHGRMLIAQFVFLISLLIGISGWSWQAAFIVGGIVGIAAIEMQPKPENAGKARVT